LIYLVMGAVLSKIACHTHAAGRSQAKTISADNWLYSALLEVASDASFEKTFSSLIRVEAIDYQGGKSPVQISPDHTDSGDEFNKSPSASGASTATSFSGGSLSPMSLEHDDSVGDPEQDEENYLVYPEFLFENDAYQGKEIYSELKNNKGNQAYDFSRDLIWDVIAAIININMRIESEKDKPDEQFFLSVANFLKEETTTHGTTLKYLPRGLGEKDSYTCIALLLYKQEVGEISEFDAGNFKSVTYGWINDVPSKFGIPYADNEANSLSLPEWFAKLASEDAAHKKGATGSAVHEVVILLEWMYQKGRMQDEARRVNKPEIDFEIVDKNGKVLEIDVKETRRWRGYGSKRSARLNGCLTASWYFGRANESF